MHTGNTVTKRSVSLFLLCNGLVVAVDDATGRLVPPMSSSANMFFELHIPDGEDAASLSEARLLLDATDALLEDGGNLSRGGLVGVGTGLHGGAVQGGGCGISDLR